MHIMCITLGFVFLLSGSGKLLLGLQRWHQTRQFLQSSTCWKRTAHLPANQLFKYL